MGVKMPRRVIAFINRNFFYSALGILMRLIGPRTFESERHQRGRATRQAIKLNTTMDGVLFIGSRLSSLTTVGLEIRSKISESFEKKSLRLRFYLDLIYLFDEACF